MTTETLSAVIFVVFVGLVVVAVISTGARYFRYRRRGMKPPLLLKRDVALFVGLAIPFVILAAVRVFPELRETVTDGEGRPHFWYLILTGLPPIGGLAVYCWFELAVIERDRATPRSGETALQAEDRAVGDTRRELQAEAAARNTEPDQPEPTQ